jgi:hypothetical protein
MPLPLSLPPHNTMKSGTKLQFRTPILPLQSLSSVDLQGEFSDQNTKLLHAAWYHNARRK